MYKVHDWSIDERSPSGWRGFGIGFDFLAYGTIISCPVRV